MRKPKPPVSEWIIRERKRMGWKPLDISDRLKAAGYEAEESTVQVWEAGRSPSATNIEGLERLFGSTAPREREDQGDLAAVIAAQTVAIGRQTDVLERVLALLEGRGGSGLSRFLAALSETEPSLSETDEAEEVDPRDGDVEGAVPGELRR